MSRHTNHLSRLFSIIAELLLDPGPYTIKETAEKYGVTERQIRNDLKRLMEFLNDANQKDYIIHRKGFYEGNFSRSVANLKPEVRLYLFLALRQIEPMLPEEGKQAYELLLKHAFSVLPHQDIHRLKEWSRFYHISTYGYPKERKHFYEALHEIFEAIYYGKTISFIKNGKKRYFDPYAVYYVKNNFYLIGTYYQINKKNLLLTRLDRVKDLKKLSEQQSPLLPECYHRLEDVRYNKEQKAKSFISSMLEAERDQSKPSDYTFYILDQKVLNRIYEKQWHASQEIKLISKEIVLGKRKVLAELKFKKVESPTELKKWVLGWGSAIYVKQPVSFRQEIEQEIKQMVSLYPINSFFK
ncbi:helix-turn-helix transcriptional regulator [Thermoflavimicrobium daqui]|uniref:WCX domain-containing protein n=1 Tax=Thermoflavimicrobium daqui TaxID=2137476 RepID=A0A364K788_9BACL|nr:WYL domain-containing protein [Thermoflavimicrobium daqui]RAL26153.1 hypothetical protein DL897_03910 [Thermoflavimicrobium daqui]